MAVAGLRRMSGSPRARKFTLTAHVVFSVGWLGATVAALALAIVAVVARDVPTVRAAYLATSLTGWAVLVPFAVASLFTGFVEGLTTKWGLVRHHWVLAKLVMNLVATAVLLLYMQILATLNGIAAKPTWSGMDLELLRSPRPVVHAVAALVLLLVATGLSVYKPRGMTRYGLRRPQTDRALR